MTFQSSHKLDFRTSPWKNPLSVGPLWNEFFIGTCRGQWRESKESYEILSLLNTTPGNGHFDDVLEWFSHLAKGKGKDLLIRQCWNAELKRHLVNKRGFASLGENVIRCFPKGK